LAGSFPPGFLETVRSAVDIVRLVSDYVPLKVAGSRHKGLCPFHQEKTPSFSVDPERKLFYCFGCQTGGDVFKFVMLYDKVPFPEAVESVAKRAGVPLPRPDRAAPAGPHERLFQLNAVAEAFFRETLTDPGAGSRGREYLVRRGLGEDTVHRLGLGLAPAGWDALRSHLLSRRFRPEEGLIAGLLLPRKSGSGEYDRFRDRLIFPIHDVQGRTVAFGGRSLGDEEPKYINSPETPAYKKGEHLYGLDLAKDAIRREGFAIVVEGYLDLAAVVQAGFLNVVASLGTAFTEGQARLLARYCDRALFSYDADGAGVAATVRSLDLLLGKGFEVRVVQLPSGCDPDDFIHDHGGEAYGGLLRDAPVYLEFLIRREAGARDLTRAEERVAGVHAVLPHLARLTSAVERSAWATRLADALRIEDESVREELRSAVRSSRERIRQRPPAPERLPAAESRLVSRLLSAPGRGEALPEIAAEDLEGTRIAPLVQAIARVAATGTPVDYPTVLDALDSDEDRALLTRIAFGDEPEPGPSAEDCLRALRHERLTREERRLARTIDDLQRRPAASVGAEIDQQLRRLQQIARMRDSLS
jgi:DNA primase